MTQRAVRQGAPVSKAAYTSLIRILARYNDFESIPMLLESMEKDAGCVLFVKPCCGSGHSTQCTFTLSEAHFTFGITSSRASSDNVGLLSSDGVVVRPSVPNFPRP